MDKINIMIMDVKSYIFAWSIQNQTFSDAIEAAAAKCFHNGRTPVIIKIKGE